MLGYLLDLSVQDGGVRVACGVGDDKVSLVPRRVIPHVLLQQPLHKLQLAVPQLVLLADGQQHIGAQDWSPDTAAINYRAKHKEQATKKSVIQK